MSETATLTSASVSGQCSNKTGSNRISDPTLAADIPPSNPVKTETIEDLQILLEDLKVNACQDNPQVGNAPRINQFAQSKSLEEIKKEYCPEVGALEDRFSDGSGGESSDDDWDETRASSPVAKCGGLSINLEEADRWLAHRQYFVVHGQSGVPDVYCWGVHPAAPRVSNIYRVEWSESKTTLHFCLGFAHLEANVGTCVQAMDHHFILPSPEGRELYRVAGNGQRSTRVKLYLDETEAFQACFTNYAPESPHPLALSADFQGSNPQLPQRSSSPTDSIAMASSLALSQNMLLETPGVGITTSISGSFGQVTDNGRWQRPELPSSGNTSTFPQPSEVPRRNSLNTRVAGAEQAIPVPPVSSSDLGLPGEDYPNNYAFLETNSSPGGAPPAPRAKYARLRNRASSRSPGKFFGVDARREQIDDWVDQTATTRREAGPVGNSLMKCPEAGCSSRPRRPHALKTHIYGHYGIKPFSCKECPSDFLTQDGLKKHMGNFHKCLVCLVKMSKADLKDHKKDCRGTITNLTALAGACGMA